jgi:hypothetical protein
MTDRALAFGCRQLGCFARSKDHIWVPGRSAISGAFQVALLLVFDVTKVVAPSTWKSEALLAACPRGGGRYRLRTQGQIT